MMEATVSFAYTAEVRRFLFDTSEELTKHLADVNFRGTDCITIQIRPVPRPTVGGMDYNPFAGT